MTFKTYGQSKVLTLLFPFSSKHERRRLLWGDRNPWLRLDRPLSRKHPVEQLQMLLLLASHLAIVIAIKLQLVLSW